MKKLDRKKSDRKKRWRYLLGNFHFRNLKKFITQPIPSFTVFSFFYGLNPLDRKKSDRKKGDRKRRTRYIVQKLTEIEQKM